MSIAALFIMETAQVPYNWWVDQEIVVYMYMQWSITHNIHSNDMWFEGEWMQVEDII
jgi:hypothetical protein